MNKIFQSCILAVLVLFIFSSPAGAMGGQAGGGGTNSLIEAIKLSLINNPLSITSNNNPYATLSFCQPVPTDYLDFQTSTPSSKNCGVYKFDLVNFPANNLPSGGTTNRISPSEMAFAYVKIENYPDSGNIKMSWYRADGTQMYSLSTPVKAKADPSWTWWYWYAWSFVGHFDWEINAPGKYYLLVETTWGNSRIDFDVVDTTPNPPTVGSCFNYNGQIRKINEVSGTPLYVYYTWWQNDYNGFYPLSGHSIYDYNMPFTEWEKATPISCPSVIPTPSPTPTPGPGVPTTTTPILANLIATILAWLKTLGA